MLKWVLILIFLSKNFIYFLCYNINLSAVVTEMGNGSLGIS